MRTTMRKNSMRTKKGSLGILLLTALALSISACGKGNDNNTNPVTGTPNQVITDPNNPYGYTTNPNGGAQFWVTPQQNQYNYALQRCDLSGFNNCQPFAYLQCVAFSQCVIISTGGAILPGFSFQFVGGRYLVTAPPYFYTTWGTYSSWQSFSYTFAPYTGVYTNPYYVGGGFGLGFYAGFSF